MSYLCPIYVGSALKDQPLPVSGRVGRAPSLVEKADYAGLILPQDRVLHPGYFTVACPLLSDTKTKEQQSLYPLR